MDNKKEIIIDIIKKQDLISLKSFIKENTDFPFNFTTDNGKNLLHYAANKVSHNTLSVIQILLEKGLDPLAVDENFESAIDVAEKNNNIPALTIMNSFVNKRMHEVKTYF